MSKSLEIKRLSINTDTEGTSYKSFEFEDDGSEDLSHDGLERNSVNTKYDSDDDVSFQTISVDEVSRKLDPPRKRITALTPKREVDSSTQTLIRKKSWRCCIISFVVSLFLIFSVLIYFLLPSIAQAILNASNMTIQSINITNANDKSFTASIRGKISDVGPFNAATETMDLEIVYLNDVIGTMRMDPINLKMGEGLFSVSQTVFIKNSTAFSLFSSVLVSQKKFVWLLRGNTNLNVMGMINIKSLKVNKRVFLNGNLLSYNDLICIY